MRKLTGNWYIKKTLFGFKIMVETIQQSTCSFSFDLSPEFKKWEKAKDEDILKLNIKII